MAEDPVAPTDPRTQWLLPAFGELPVVEHLDDLVTRILAPNPSPMTLDGTNTYVVGRPGAGEVAIVDPGPDDPGHLARVRDVVSDADAAVRAVVVTHHHVDHAEAATSFAVTFGCQVMASAPQVAGPSGRILADGDVVPIAGTGLEVVATPGHTRDHVAIRLETGALLTGDHVLGRGTSVVAYPDGDLTAYLASLRKVLELGPDALYPGHGPALVEDPGAVLEFYREHRGFREGQVLSVLAGGPARPDEIVAVIYAAVDRRVWPAAEASTRATLAALEDAGTVRAREDGSFALRG